VQLASVASLASAGQLATVANLHENALLLFEKYATPFFQDGQRVLEIGPDAIPSAHQRVLQDVALQWDTADRFRAASQTYTLTQEYSYPIPDDLYDITLSSSVIEHVRKPWRWIRRAASLQSFRSLRVSGGALVRHDYSGTQKYRFALSG
jgi:hypothetical protein